MVLKVSITTCPPSQVENDESLNFQLFSASFLIPVATSLGFSEGVGGTEVQISQERGEILI